MVAQSATKAILNWIYSTSFEDIPPETTRSAVLAIYDTIGCMLASSLLPVAHRMVDFVKILGGSSHCTVIGFPLRTSVTHAALVNGTLGHADEVDAVENDRLGRHSLSTCTATAMAAGQFAGASGREVVRAVVLGRELAKRVDSVAIKAGRDTATDASNTMGAAVTAGILMGLPRDRMDVTLSLAATMACGITPVSRDIQHMAKSFVKGGVGAKNGVAAALMAKVGYDAPRDIFDGPKGFFDSRIGLETVGAEFLAGRDREFGLGELIFKRYAAGSPNLAPRQALLELMSENGLVADDIQDILAEVPPNSLKVMNVPYPTYHGKGVLALAALHGGIGFREVHQKVMYTSPAANSMRERIKIEGRPDWKGRGHFHAAVTLTTKDGRKFRRETDYRRMTEDELDVKFSQLVGLRAGATKAAHLGRMLKQLDTVDNVADLMVQLEFPDTTIDEV